MTLELLCVGERSRVPPPLRQQSESSLMAILPEEIRQSIFSMAGNPLCQQVCREWRNYDFYKQLLIDYKNNPLFAFLDLSQNLPESEQACRDVVVRVVQLVAQHHQNIGFHTNVIDPVSLKAILSSTINIKIINRNLVRIYYRFQGKPLMMPHLSSGIMAEQAMSIRKGVAEDQIILDSITSVYLSHCLINLLPPEIGLLKNLRTLVAPFNKLWLLPRELFNLKN